MRNVQILDLDIEMQEMDRRTSREHLLIDFSSSGSSDELDASKKDNEEDGLISSRISPASSDIGILPFHRRLPVFDHTGVPLVDLAPGTNAFPLVDLDDGDDGLSIMPKPISKSISEPLPITPLPSSMVEAKLIDFHSEPQPEHVLVNLDVQDDNNVPQQGQSDLVPAGRTYVDLVSKPTTITEAATLPLDESPIVNSVLQDRLSSDSSMKPITIVDNTPTFVPARIPNSFFPSAEESSQRGRRAYQHPLEEVHEEWEAISEKVEVGLTVTTGIEDEELASEHNNHQLHDHHDNDSPVYNEHHDHHSLLSLGTSRGEELQSLSLSPQVVAIPPVQATPTWYWDHEDDPWNGAVNAINEEGVDKDERDIEEESVGERQVLEDHREKVGEIDEKGVDSMHVSEMEAGLEIGEDEDAVKTLPGVKTLDLHVECSLEDVPTETGDEESYPDPDYLPLPELLLAPIPATEVPLILVENGLPDRFQEIEAMDESQSDQDDKGNLSQHDEKSPRQIATQIPTPPASPPPISLHVKSLGLGGSACMRNEPPSPSSLRRPLLPLSTSQPTSPRAAPLVVSAPDTSSPSTTVEVQVKVSEGDKENITTGVDKENETLNSTTGRPLWSIRADDAPALGLAANSLSTSTSTPSDSLIPGVGTSTGVSPRIRRKVLGDITAVVENGEEVKEVEIKQEIMKADMDKEETKEEKDEESSLPGAFPELLKPTNSSSTIVAPTITVATLTSTLLSTSIAAASSSVSSTSTSTLSPSPIIKRRQIVRSPLDIALAMQLRPGLGVGADPAWMVRFLMAMFGWFAILVSGRGEF